MIHTELSLAHIYELPDRFFLHPMALTQAGFWLAVPPGQRLPLDTPPEALGTAVRTLVERPRDRVPTPTRDDYPNLTKPILEAGGLTSWLRLERKARLCEVVGKLDEFLVIPTENGGSRGKGFHRLEDGARALKPDAPPVQLGAEIINALANSRGASDRGL